MPGTVGAAVVPVGAGGSDHFQPMPDLTPEQDEALRADIAARGVLVPVVVDQHGRVLDGHNRRRIAAELGVNCPIEVREVADDDEAAELAVVLNCARRQLTREQTRAVITAEIDRRPDDSDRRIARRVGCSPTTVGTVRSSTRVSNLDTSPMSAAEAEDLTAKIKGHVDNLVDDAWALLYRGLANGVAPKDLAAALHTAQERSVRRDPGPSASVFAEAMFTPLQTVLGWKETAEGFRRFWDHAEFVPLTPTEYQMVLDGVASIGGEE